MFDLASAMRKKEEFESARLMDFEFRQRVRAVRALAKELGMDPSIASAVVVEASDAEVPARIAVITGRSIAEICSGYARCLEDARAQLVAELGDPTPHRLG